LWSHFLEILNEYTCMLTEFLINHFIIAFRAMYTSDENQLGSYIMWAEVCLLWEGFF
jgi:hypothetical protein